MKIIPYLVLFILFISFVSAERGCNNCNNVGDINKDMNDYYHSYYAKYYELNQKQYEEPKITGMAVVEDTQWTPIVSGVVIVALLAGVIAIAERFRKES